MQVDFQINTRQHTSFLAQAVLVWAAFWVLGLPKYYQQYSQTALAVGSILLSVAISLSALVALIRVREERRMARAFWISFYFTVPFAVLDTWYCGFYLGHGWAYVWKYWYLGVFYFTPWLTFVPTALLLRGVPAMRKPTKR
jgi:hypothetical protein